MICYNLYFNLTASILAFIEVTLHDSVGIKHIIQNTDTLYIKMVFVEPGLYKIFMNSISYF